MATPAPTRPRAARKRQEVAAGLRSLIETLSPGDRLPSVGDLERRFGVATGTVEAAVRQLRGEGLVESRSGSGTYIADRAAPPPREAAAGGAEARTDTLAVFAFGSTPFYQTCVEEIVAQAAERNLAVKCWYADFRLTAEDVERVDALEPTGYVAVGLEWVAELLRARGRAVAVISEPPAGVTPRVPTAFADAEQGGYLATRRLVDLGHRRIVYVHRLNEAELPRKRRWHGHARALHEAGVEEPYPSVGAVTLQAWTEDPAAVRSYFGARGAPTGVVAWSDPAAVMTIGALHRAGLRVPDDVSVVGYDNLPLGAHLWPPLDTVDQHIPALVRHALHLISQPETATVVSTAIVTPTLIRRASCAPPPTGP